MRLLSDCPDRISDWFSAAPGWARVRSSVLPEEERLLWDGLGASGEPWLGCWAEDTSGFWSRAVVVANAPASQFDALSRLLRSGLRPAGPIAAVALEGSDFHGQRGRRWATVAGNLHLCVALETAGLAAKHGFVLTALPAIAVCEGVSAATGGAVRPAVKWVNDIIVQERKIAGVITTTQVLHGRVTSAVPGIGLNVATTPAVAPTPFVPLVASLSDFGAEPSLGGALVSILAQIARLHALLVASGPSALVELYRRLSIVIGRDVFIWDESVGEAGGNQPLPAPLAAGRVREILPDLSLALEGVAEPVCRGRLAFAEHVPPSSRSRL